MAYETTIINGVTKLTQANGTKVWFFGKCNIEVTANSTAYKLYYPASPDSPSSTQEFADIPVGQRFGAANISDYVDALATNDFFGDKEGSFGGVIFVTSLLEFPEASGGVITLEADKTYILTADIDIEGNRIETVGVNSFYGYTPEIGKLRSTGLAGNTPLITTAYTFALNNVALVHGYPIHMDATGNSLQVIDWYGVNFEDATTMLIKNYDNIICNVIGFLNSSGLTIDGTTSTVAFTDTIFNANTAGTSITIPDTATILRRFRIYTSSFIALSGETALNISVSASIPNEGYILSDVNFSGGGTYLAGVQATDNKARFEGCRGIDNSANVSQYYMQANATPTTFAGAGTATKILGTTTSGDYVQKFTNTNNRAAYTGSLNRFFKITLYASMAGSANNEIAVSIAKNGTPITASLMESTLSSGGRAENVAASTVVSLATNDYVEAYLQNNTGTAQVVVERLNMLIQALN